MNKIDFSDILTDEKKKENEVNKQIKVERKKTFFCPHANCSIEFAYEQNLKEHILHKHSNNKLNSLSEEKKEIIQTAVVVKKIKINCKYCDCSLLEKNYSKHLKKCPDNPNNIQKKKKKVTKTFTVTKKIDNIDFLKERIISINTTLSMTVDRIIHDEILEDINNLRVLSFNNISDSQKSMYQMIKEYYEKLLVIEKNKSWLKELLNIQCEYCLDFFYNKNSLLTHVQSEHKESLGKFLKKNNIKKSYCKYCDKFIISKFFQKHYNKCSKTKCEYCDKFMNKDKYPQHIQKCLQYKKTIWEKNSSIKEIVEEKETLTNIEKHQAKLYQFREDEELDPDLIDEEEYQKTFGTQLYDKSQQIRARVAFEHEKIYKQEEEDKSEIKIFLSKMYKGYCQVCGYTFRKTNGINSFERFNWNDKRVVKVKKSLVSTADSLCLCRNCSANIKWGAFYPNFVDTIREIEDFKSKSYDEIREKLHKVVDEDIPKVFDFYLHEDVYALEIELDGKPRNIYFTNEHLLQFVTYLQKEDEVEEEVIIKKRKKEIYTKNSWLARDENIPKELAIDFLRATIYHPNHSSGRPVSMSSRAYEIYKNTYHGWAIKINDNPFLVGKAIERCKNELNDYIENKIFDLDKLREKLHYCIRGAVATSNNDEYNGYYPLEKGRFMKFGWNAIDVDKGVEFLIREIGLD